MTKSERERCERRIQKESVEISSRQFNYLCSQAAVRGDFYSRYRSNNKQNSAL